MNRIKPEETTKLRKTRKLQKAQEQGRPKPLNMERQDQQDETARNYEIKESGKTTKGTKAGRTKTAKHQWTG